MIIVADKHIPYVKEYFTPHGELILKSGRDIKQSDVQHADVLLVRSITSVDKNLLENTNVKFVGSVTTGADHLDTKWLDAAGIAWCTVHGFNAPPDADYVVSVIAALENKKLLHANRRVAIIGVGKIGKLVCENLKKLNFDVVLCDPLRADQEENFYSVALDDIADVDLITLHVPLTQQGPHATHHFIDDRFLVRQKENCILLNTSRGAVIDSATLLQHGKHLKWCLDVFEHEPKINQAILQQAIIATPHIAGYSVQGRIRGIHTLYQAMLEKKVIPLQTAQPISMPSQKLLFANRKYTWQEIVLGIFNPSLMTDMLRTVLLSSKHPAVAFDDLRNQFHDRHEFSFTQIDAQLEADDESMLKQLGFQITGSGLTPFQ